MADSVFELRYTIEKLSDFHFAGLIFNLELLVFILELLNLSIEHFILVVQILNLLLLLEDSCRLMIVLLFQIHVLLF